MVIGVRMVCLAGGKGRDIKLESFRAACQSIWRAKFEQAAKFNLVWMLVSVIPGDVCGTAVGKALD